MTNSDIRARATLIRENTEGNVSLIYGSRLDFISVRHA